MTTGLSVQQFKDLYLANWALDWDGAGTAFKAALFGTKTIDFSAAVLAYNSTPFNSGEQIAPGSGSPTPYVAGGIAVPGRTVTETATSSGVVAFIATFMEWNPISTLSVVNFVVYKVADNKILGVWDLGTPANIVNGIFRVTFASDRLVTHKVIP